MRRDLEARQQQNDSRHRHQFFTRCPQAFAKDRQLRRVQVVAADVIQTFGSTLFIGVSR